MTARELPELRECPWCGEPLPSLIVSEGSTFRWRKVEGCCTDGPEVRHYTLANDQDAAEEDSRARAIAAWNTRAAPRVSEGMVDAALFAFRETGPFAAGTQFERESMRQALEAALGARGKDGV